MSPIARCGWASNPISRADAALALLDRIDRGLADRGILISRFAAPADRVTCR